VSGSSAQTPVIQRRGGERVKIDRGCVKTSARFHTSLFRSLLRGLRAFRVEKIAKNLALLDRLQNVVEFLYGLDPLVPFKIGPVNGREARESGPWLKASVAQIPVVARRRGAQIAGDHFSGIPALRRPR
jgi:hypothetical protein